MKWLGALIIISLSRILGILAASEEKQKLRALESLLDLLKYIRRRISSERAPLYKLFAAFRDDYLEESGFLPIMREHRENISISWNRAVEKIPLDSQTKKELLHLGEELGALPLEQQERRMDACMELLEQEKEKLKNTLPAAQKTIKTVCLLGGLLLAILLL